MKRIMRTIIFMTVTGIFFFGSAPLEASPHPDVVLIDYQGNPVALDGNMPYSPKLTCGGCHDYEMITNAYHFQQGRTDAEGRIVVSDGFDSKKPWNLSDGMYGKW